MMVLRIRRIAVLLGFLGTFGGLLAASLVSGCASSSTAVFCQYSIWSTVRCSDIFVDSALRHRSSLPQFDVPIR